MFSNIPLDIESFNQLALLTSNYIGIPKDAVLRDYYIALLLKNLQDSIYVDNCVFKGGTSLSKCYANSINRFSEDIDLTYITEEDISDKQYNKVLKKIENIMIGDFFSEKIKEERNNRNKSSYIWFNEDNKDNEKIKLEIGSSVRPDPYEKRSIKTYIQEYLESTHLLDVIDEYELVEVNLNVINIERTFIDKLLSVKRHAICGSLDNKVRHIYDVVKLYEMDEIQVFLSDSAGLKKIVQLTKETDSFYLTKRHISKEFNPTETYNFPKWQICFNEEIKNRYESLHQDLLFTDKKQDFNKAIEVFKEISNILKDIGE